MRENSSGPPPAPRPHTQPPNSEQALPWDHQRPWGQRRRKRIISFSKWSLDSTTDPPCSGFQFISERTEDNEDGTRSTRRSKKYEWHCSQNRRGLRLEEPVTKACTPRGHNQGGRAWGYPEASRPPAQPQTPGRALRARSVLGRMPNSSQQEATLTELPGSAVPKADGSETQRQPSPTR